MHLVPAVRQRAKFIVILYRLCCRNAVLVSYNSCHNLVLAIGLTAYIYRAVA